MGYGGEGMQLGKTIKAYRKQCSISQEQLASKLYVSRQTVSSWENDKSYPDIQSLVLLSEIFGTTVDQLVREDYKVMQNIASPEDRAEFKKWGSVMALLLLVTLVSAVPLIVLLDWPGIGIWLALYVLTMIAAFKVERLKRHHELRTYKEIVAFMEGKTLDEIAQARESGKYVYQKGYVIIAITLISIIVTYAMMKVLM